MPTWFEKEFDRQKKEYFAPEPEQNAKQGRATVEEIKSEDRVANKVQRANITDAPDWMRSPVNNNPNHFEHTLQHVVRSDEKVKAVSCRGSNLDP